MSEKRKPTRLQRKKFDYYDELIEYIEDNQDEVHHYTLNRLKDFWEKNKKIGNVDTYSVSIGDSPNLKHMSIFENEWEHALFEIEEHFVSREMYEYASQVRDFSWEIFGKTEL